MDLLLSYGAGIGLENKEGESALDVAEETLCSHILSESSVEDGKSNVRDCKIEEISYIISFLQVLQFRCQIY